MLGMHKVLPQMRRKEVKCTTGFILLIAAVSPALLSAQSSGVVFSPAAGQYQMPMQVALSPAQPGAPGHIYYTTNGSDPHGVTFDAFDESADTSIKSHIPDEGRSNAGWRIHPSSFQGGQTTNDIIIDSIRKAARGKAYNARAYIPVGSNNVTLTAVVDAQGGTTEFALQARLQTPPNSTTFDKASNTYYQIRIKPDENIVEVSRTVGNISTELGALTVPLADAGAETLSFSVSGRNPVELVGFKGNTRIFRRLDSAPNRIQVGTNAAMRFRFPQSAPPTGEIAFFQVVERARSVAKPTRRYAGPITLTNSALIRAYQRNGAASSAVSLAQYIRQ
jgi:hypothetical protein